MAIKSQKDFFAGLMFTVVGAAFAIGAKGYSVGSGARMGPGYFPLMLGVLMAFLGSLIIINSLRSGPAGGDKIGKWAWKQIFFILAANFVFGVLIGGLPSIGLPPMGLIVGIYVLVFIASLAGSEFKVLPTLVLATVLAIGSYIAFIWALKVQMPVWPTFITG